jgi:hypothetical protein
MEAIEHSHSGSANTVMVDALPYIDHGYDEAGVREAVSWPPIFTFCKQQQKNVSTNLWI